MISPPVYTVQMVNHSPSDRKVRPPARSYATLFQPRCKRSDSTKVVVLVMFIAHRLSLCVSARVCVWSRCCVLAGPDWHYYFLTVGKGGWFLYFWLFVTIDHTWGLLFVSLVELSCDCGSSWTSLLLTGIVMRIDKILVAINLSNTERGNNDVSILLRCHDVTGTSKQCYCIKSYV